MLHIVKIEKCQTDSRNKGGSCIENEAAEATQEGSHGGRSPDLVFNGRSPVVH
jgi:hypothetical protein